MDLVYIRVAENMSTVCVILSFSTFFRWLSFSNFFPANRIKISREPKIRKLFPGHLLCNGVISRNTIFSSNIYRKWGFLIISRYVVCAIYAVYNMHLTARYKTWTRLANNKQSLKSLLEVSKLQFNERSWHYLHHVFFNNILINSKINNNLTLGYFTHLKKISKSVYNTHLLIFDLIE